MPEFRTPWPERHRSRLVPSSRIGSVTEETLSIVSEIRDNAHYVAPSGELDIATVELLERALLELVLGDVILHG